MLPERPGVVQCMLATCGYTVPTSATLQDKASGNVAEVHKIL